MLRSPLFFFFFFFNDTATTEIYTLSLHDALPISGFHPLGPMSQTSKMALPSFAEPSMQLDRKSTRLNSSHQIISYAVFCLKKKKNRKCRQRKVDSRGLHALRCEQIASRHALTCVI